VLEDAPSGLKILRREQTVDGSVIGSTVVARYVDGALTSVTYAPGNMTLTVTARVGTGPSETRTYEVKPRPGA
jgi:hypothetical protein